MVLQSPVMKPPLFALAVVFLTASSLSAAAEKAKPVAAAPPKPFSVVEATIPEMRLAMEQKRTTSHEIVQQYLTRIAMYEDQLNAVDSRIASIRSQRSKH